MYWFLLESIGFLLDIYCGSWNVLVFIGKYWIFIGFVFAEEVPKWPAGCGKPEIIKINTFPKRIYIETEHTIFWILLEFYWILLKCIGFYWKVLDFYWTILGFSWNVLVFIGKYWIFIGFVFAEEVPKWPAGRGKPEIIKINTFVKKK